MKTCRFCAEPMQDAAIVCPHCHRETGIPAQAKATVVVVALFVLLVVAAWVISVVYR